MRYIEVDFNNTDMAGHTFARLVRASGSLSVGGEVLASDGDEQCIARVERVTQGMAYLSLHMETWMDVPKTTTGNVLSL